MGSTVSKSPKSDTDKNRRLRGSATVGCEKSDEEDIKSTVANNYNMKKGKMRLSALLPQQRNNNYNSKLDNDSHNNNILSNNTNANQQKQKQRQQKKKKIKGKKHNVKSISIKRNARYKRVTKSIIGKPSNFQHMGHFGPDQQFTPRTIRHPDDQILAQQLHDITVRVNSIMNDGDDQMTTIPVSPATPTSSSTMYQQKTEISSSSSLPKEENNQQQKQIKRSHLPHNQQQRQSNLGPPPPPPAHWSSLALRQAMKRQHQINYQKRMLHLQQQQHNSQQNSQLKTQQRISGTKMPSTKRRNHPVSSKRMKQLSTGRRPRANHVSPNMSGMPPSLRLGPAR